MTNVVSFVPRAKLDARGNLAEFVGLAREELTAFGGGGAWGEDRWQQGRTVAVFATKTAPQTSYSFVPMAEPFKDFAKAYVRYKYSHRPVVSVAFWIHALRCIEAALLVVHGRADISLLNLVVMDVSANKCREFYDSEDVWHKTGLVLQAICDFCREYRLVASVPDWKSPFRKPVILTEDLGEAGVAHRAAKLPSNTTMLMLADLFAQAEDKESRYYTSIMVLLMVAPGRISEVLRLPRDCVAWEEDEAGERQMYLRWHAAKGKGTVKKWVIPAMHGVVEEAVNRLGQIGEPARLAARFAYEHPGRFMGHPGCIVDPEGHDDHPLTAEEFCAAVGIGSIDSATGAPEVTHWPQLASTKWVATLRAGGDVTYRRLAQHALQTLGGEHWPFIAADRKVKTWDALCVHRVNEFHKDFAPREFSWRLPSANEVNARLEDSKGLSLFERFGLRHSDGSSIKLTTHQLRHWLSTMCQRAGMDDLTLAQWAGRANVAHNRHYDHRSPEERLSEARQLILGDEPSVLERFKARQPVSYRELGVDRLGTAKATLYGMCTHDYAMTPCMKQRECMTCKEHVCIRGDHVTLERIRVLEEQTALLLERAQRAHEDGIFGADRWVDNHKWKLANVRAMRMALEHPDVLDGTVLRIPDGHDPSPIQRVLMDLGATEVPVSGAAALPVASRALPGGDDA